MYLCLVLECKPTPLKNCIVLPIKIWKKEFVFPKNPLLFAALCEPAIKEKYQFTTKYVVKEHLHRFF